MKTLLHYLALHGVTAIESSDGNIRALDEYTQHGVYGCEWVTLPPTLKAVREFCGY